MSPAGAGQELDSLLVPTEVFWRTLSMDICESVHLWGSVDLRTKVWCRYLLPCGVGTSWRAVLKASRRPAFSAARSRRRAVTRSSSRHECVHARSLCDWFEPAHFTPGVCSTLGSCAACFAKDAVSLADTSACASRAHERLSAARAWVPVAHAKAKSGESLTAQDFVGRRRRTWTKF